MACEPKYTNEKWNPCSGFKWEIRYLYPKQVRPKVWISLRRVVIKTSSGDVYLLVPDRANSRLAVFRIFRTFRVNKCLDISDETRNLTESSSGRYQQYRKYFRTRFHLSHFCFSWLSVCRACTHAKACIHFEVIYYSAVYVKLRSI